MSHYFFCVELCFSSTKSRASVDLSIPYLANNVTFALKSLFGEVGAAIPIEILKSTEKAPASIDFLLRCPAHVAVKVRAALTLQGTFQGHECAYHVLAADSSLLQIAEGGLRDL